MKNWYKRNDDFTCFDERLILCDLDYANTVRRLTRNAPFLALSITLVVDTFLTICKSAEGWKFILVGWVLVKIVADGIELNWIELNKNLRW